jgi:hypothetical protein
MALHYHQAAKHRKIHCSIGFASQLMLMLCCLEKAWSFHVKPLSQPVQRYIKRCEYEVKQPAALPVLLPILHSLTTISRYFWDTTNKAAIFSSPLISLRCLLHSFGYWIDMVNKIHFFRYGNGFVAKSFSLRPGGRAAGR